MSDKIMSRRSMLAGSLGVGAGALGLAGCGGSSSSTSVPKGWTGVTFMSTGDSPTQQLFKQMIAAAQKDELDARKIKLIWQPAPSSDWARIMQLFVNDTAADVQRIDDDRVYALAADNKIHQLDPWLLDKKDGLPRDKYSETFWTNNTVEGYKFSIEPYLSANVVYYNVDILDKAGITPPTSWATPWEWDEFVDVVHKLTTKKGGRTNVYGVGFPPNVIQPQGYGAGDSALNADQTACGFTSKKALQSIDALISLIRDGSAPTVDVDQLSLFNSGRLAMMWADMESISQLATSIKWDLAPWPKAPLYALTKNFARSFVIPKSAKNPEAAYLALRAVCGVQAQKVIAKNRLGVPGLKSAAGSSAFSGGGALKHPEIWTQTMGTIGGRTVAVPFPRGPVAEKWQSVFTNGPLENGLMSGRMKTADYLRQAQAAVNAEIKQLHWKKGAGLKKLESVGALTDPDSKVTK